jgi:cell division septal protein FtsQ
MIVQPRKPAIRRRSAFSSKSRRRKGGLKLIALLLVTVSSCYAAFRFDLSSYFAIKRITVNKTALIREAYLDSICRSLLLGRSMLSGLGEEKNAIAAEPLVKEVHFSRHFPDCLIVQVEERKPVALVNVGELVPVDMEGIVLPLPDSLISRELPILTPRTPSLASDEEYSNRVRLNREGLRLLEAVLEFRQLAPEMLPLLSEFTLDEQGKITLVTLDDGIKVVMGKWVRKENIRYLQWMLSQLAGRADKPVLIDLSFEGQIILKNRKES